MRAVTPPRVALPYLENGREEAGSVLEHYMFGGIYHRYADGGRRSLEYMVSLMNKNLAFVTEDCYNLHCFSPSRRLCTLSVPRSALTRCLIQSRR